MNNTVQTVNSNSTRRYLFIVNLNIVPGIWESYQMDIFSLTPCKLWLKANQWFLTGFTNIVGVCLCLLYYISNLSAISLNLILVMFCVAMLLFANIMLMLGGLKNRQQFLIPWLAITILALISAIVYCSINWGTLLEFKVSLGKG